MQALDASDGETKAEVLLLRETTARKDLRKSHPPQQHADAQAEGGNEKSESRRRRIATSIEFSGNDDDPEDDVNQRKTTPQELPSRQKVMEDGQQTQVLPV